MLKKLLPIVMLVYISLAVQAQVPPNDNCADAIAVAAAELVIFNTTEATTDGPLHLNSPCPSADNDTLWRDIWYVFTPDFTGKADWSLCGTADFDTKIAVYNPGATCPLQNNDLFTCNDDFGSCTGNTSRLIFDVTAGQSYLLRLGGWGATAPGAGGAGTFEINEFISAVPNDLCELAIDVNLGPGQPVSNIGATTDGPQHPGNSACFGFNDPTVQADIWYRFTAPSSSAIEWSTCDNINFDSRMAVYQAGATCPLSDSDLKACNDDGAGCSNYTSRVIFDVVQGETYLLRLGGYNGDQGAGTFDLLEIIPPVPPANDACTTPDSAWIVTPAMADDFDGPIIGTTVNAYFDEDNFIFPNTQCFGTNTAGGEFADVWYWFNTYGNDTLEIRFNLDSDQPVGSFYVDLFDACTLMVDTNVITGSCVFADPINPNVATTITGLPDEPTLYLLRVTTRLTTQLPGDFWFFIVGDITAPPVATQEAFPGQYKLYPNPAYDRLELSLFMEKSASTMLEIMNTLGQTVQRQDAGNLPTGPHSFDLDVSALSKGVYFLALQSELGTSTVRFVKQ
ncbi:MAG: T9SS type A sorting domain-containing protein [Saprospiraceae bacterium]|nr:MAG: T9SS type A sorting domain-containing protein [Saprospiraceae bacterium]